MAPDGRVDQAEGAEATRTAQEAEDCGRLVEVSRLEKGWTRTQLAEAAGVTEFDVVQFETGQTTPVEPTLSRFLRAMGYVS